MKEQFTNEEIRDFCLRMSMFLHGGIGFGEGLALLTEEEKETGPGNIFRDMMKEADCGKPLSVCVRESGCFPVYVSGMLEAGEKTGRLEEALEASPATLTTAFPWSGDFGLHCCTLRCFC